MHFEEPGVPFELAIVGGGIVGVALAAGLIDRGIRVKVFEQAQEFGEVGVGLGFTRSSKECMERISHRIVEALRDGGAVDPGDGGSDPSSKFQYFDGVFAPEEGSPTSQTHLNCLDAGPRGWNMVRRDLFLLGMVKRVPQEVFRLKSRLESIEQPQQGSEGKVVLTLADGTTHTADAVIACDGIKSKARRILLGGDDKPGAMPSFTNKVAYRTLVPRDRAEEAIGKRLHHGVYFQLGPNAHMLHYPVNDKFISAVAFLHDTRESAQGAAVPSTSARQDLLKAVEGWSEPARKLAELFPENPIKWPLFDLWEHPMARYNVGRIALAGDAAHASSPHMGAGASVGIEDVLCLCTLLEKAHSVVKDGGVAKNDALQAAFEAYTSVRITRTHWLVNSSRRICGFYQQPVWGDITKRAEATSCFEELHRLSYKLWNFQPQEMVDESLIKYKQLLGALPRPTSASSGVSINGHAAVNGHASTDGHAPTNGTPASNGHHAQNGTNPTILPVQNGTTLQANGWAEPTQPQFDWLAQIPDHPGMLSTRIANLSSHMANIKQQLANGRIMVGGPSLSAFDISTKAATPAPTGSVQVIRASCADEVYQILEQDPYAKLGVWDVQKATLVPMKIGVVNPMVKA